MALVSDDTLPEPAPVDVDFTVDMSKRMTVPMHISFNEKYTNGNTPSAMSVVSSADSYKKGANELMRVPDRIIVAGGGSHMAGKNGRRDIASDNAYAQATEARGLEHIMETPPRTLTLNHFSPTHEPETDTANDQRIADKTPNLNTSVAADDAVSTSSQIVRNPLEEIRLLKRHVTRLATRVHTIEQQLDWYQQRDSVVLMLILGGIGLKTILWLAKGALRHA